MSRVMEVIGNHERADYRVPYLMRDFPKLNSEFCLLSVTTEADGPTAVEPLFWKQGLQYPADVRLRAIVLSVLVNRLVSRTKQVLIARYTGIIDRLRC